MLIIDLTAKYLQMRCIFLCLKQIYYKFNAYLKELERPAAFHDTFTINIEVHNHNTRKKSHIPIISHRIVARKQSIKVYGTKLWNFLSP